MKNNPKYLAQSCGKNHLVWLKSPNRYILLKKPAYRAFVLLMQNMPLKVIAETLCEEFRFSPLFSEKVTEEIQFFLKKVKNEKKTKNKPPDIKNFNSGISFYSTRYYSYHDKSLRMDFETKNLENIIHSYIRHLEKSDSGKPAMHYQLFRHGDLAVLRINNSRFITYSSDEAHLLTGELLFGIASYFLEDKAGEWIMTAHASAVTGLKNAVLFTGPSGSGKTTFASLLSVRGYDILNDDVIMINHEFRAFSLPISYSVKSGAIDVLGNVFPGIDRNEEFQSGNKRFRLLAPGMPQNGRKIAAIVFVKYNPEITFEFKRINRPQAIARLLNEIYIVQKDNCVVSFMKNICKTRFYSLVYSNHEPAMDAVAEILNNESN